jgi:hypothetical protein
MVLAEWFANTDMDHLDLNAVSDWAYLFNNFAHNAEFPEDEEPVEEQR